MAMSIFRLRAAAIRHPTSGTASSGRCMAPARAHLVILQFLLSNSSVEEHRHTCLGIVRLCRGWQGPATEFLYERVELVNLTLYQLFLRSLTKNKRLSDLVKNLVIPKHRDLFSLQLSRRTYTSKRTRRHSVIQALVFFAPTSTLCKFPCALTVRFIGRRACCRLIFRIWSYSQTSRPSMFLPLILMI
jgi:hypothetical protein